MIRKIVSLLAIPVSILLLLAILAPAGWFAWRAGQPMELPQFKGLTYYEYLSWRKSALHQMAVDYKAAHPNAKMGGGLDMCFYTDIAADLGLKLPLAGFYTLVDVYPGLEKYVKPPDRKYIPQDVGLLTFLPQW